jgi:hypothetical protein
MDCPVCTGVNLVMSERQGIEIDYCPKCRGVWLDRGELDKIIERSAAGTTVQAPPAAPASHSNERQHHGHAYPQHGDPYRKKKREGFLGELFDFD